MVVRPAAKRTKLTITALLPFTLTYGAFLAAVPGPRTGQVIFATVLASLFAGGAVALHRILEEQRRMRRWTEDRAADVNRMLHGIAEDVSRIDTDVDSKLISQAWRDAFGRSQRRKNAVPHLRVAGGEERR